MVYGLYYPSKEEIESCIKYNKSCSYGICDECIVLHSSQEVKNVKSKEVKKKATYVYS